MRQIDLFLLGEITDMKIREEKTTVEEITREEKKSLRDK